MYLNYSHAVFVVLLAAAFVIGPVQVWARWLLWNGERSGALLQFGLLPFEAAFWYGFALPIPPILSLVRVVLVVMAWPRLV